MQSGMTQTNGSPEFPGRFSIELLPGQWTKIKVPDSPLWVWSGGDSVLAVESGDFTDGKYV